MNAPGVGTSRRTLAKGIAWSVPVIAATVAAPMASASGQCSGTTCYGGISIHKCCGSSKFYWADVTFTNNGNTTVTVSFSFTLATSANGSLSFSGGGTVAPGQSRTFRVRSGLKGNCSQGTYEPFTLNFSDGVNPPGAVPIPGGSTGGSTCPPGSEPDQSGTEPDSAAESDAPAEPSASS